jgi:hypothetical protein
MPAEDEMAWDAAEALKAAGLRPEFRVDVWSGVANGFPVGAHKHGLPLYVASTLDCSTDKARQVARPDLIIVDTKEGVVEVTVEFETDTNPKNLLANFFAPFLAVAYTSRKDGRTYRLDPNRTLHILLACLSPRGASQNAQAAVQKGRVVANWLNGVGDVLAVMPQRRNVARARAFAGDDWPAMNRLFLEEVRRSCSLLFSQQG